MKCVVYVLHWGGYTLKHRSNICAMLGVALIATGFLFHQKGENNELLCYDFSWGNDSFRSALYFSS